ncbi:tetraspanin-8 [Orycteropus afer afer]|uniref:Tetraspanin n=1 Tax=Orycteropus afer afer TaxID=1230840 RepID=A0A8B7ARM5_ORYAF|nr:tetraspanin-8 [Orycteropus afer afer]
MAGVSGCLKYSMFIFNFLFWVCGIIILGIAILIRVNQDGQQIINHKDVHTYFNVPANILITVGSIIMILGFLGCCGAIKESRFMLILFFIGLLFILLLQVAAGVVGSVLKSKFDYVLNDILSENVALLTGTTDTAVEFQIALTKWEEKFNCCGLVSGASDWGNNFKKYSKSCECPVTSTSACTVYEGISVYQTPCYSSIKDIFKNYTIIIIGITFGLTVIEVQYHLALLISLSILLFVHWFH